MYFPLWTYNPIGNMLTRNDNNGNVTYQYNDPAHKHAVTQIGSLYYCYDQNGNMTRRNATSSACTNGDALGYDTENKLTSITVGANTTTYLYDGDGNRVKKTVNGVSTFYVGNYYEVSNGVATKYYYFGKQRVAMKVGTTIIYLHSDHLGSTSATTNSAGTSMSSQLYYAFGNVRATTGTVPTDFTFTGQRRDASANLMYYNARYYDTTLGRFVSADTMVPSSGNPQALNRYSYTLNNPILYTDPNGHCNSLSGLFDPCRMNFDELLVDANTFLTFLAEATLFGGTAYAPAEDGSAGDLMSLEANPVPWYRGVIAGAYDPADYAQTIDACSTGDCDPWRVGGAAVPFISGAVARKVGPEVARAIYDTAREFNYRGVFFAANPSLRKFSDDIIVHHAIPLEALLKRPGIFSADELNSAINLRGIPAHVNNRLHLSKIHSLWDKFWEKFPNASREQIAKFARKIDNDFNLWDLPFDEFLKE